MKIKEFYEKDLLDIAELHDVAGINVITGKLEPCTDLRCQDCALNSSCAPVKLSCDKIFTKLMNMEIKDTNWNYVPIDEKVLCKYSEEDKNWIPRYFSGVDYEGNPTVFAGGATSWSCSRGMDGNPRTIKYPIIILAEIGILKLINNMES